MTEIHCHTCGGFITDPTTVSYELPTGTLVLAAPHTGLCRCAPAIVYGPPAGYLSSPGLPSPVTPASPALGGGAQWPKKPKSRSRDG